MPEDSARLSPTPLLAVPGSRDPEPAHFGSFSKPVRRLAGSRVSPISMGGASGEPVPAHHNKFLCSRSLVSEGFVLQKFNTKEGAPDRFRALLRSELDLSYGVLDKEASRNGCSRHALHACRRHLGRTLSTAGYAASGPVRPSGAGGLAYLFPMRSGLVRVPFLRGALVQRPVPLWDSISDSFTLAVSDTSRMFLAVLSTSSLMRFTRSVIALMSS